MNRRMSCWDESTVRSQGLTKKRRGEGGMIEFGHEIEREREAKDSPPPGLRRGERKEG